MSIDDERCQQAQLELFKGWLTSESNQSRTVELFDAIPKYVFDKKAKTTTKIEGIVREFEFRKVPYNVTITPANIERKGNFIGVYPGEREEIVTRGLLQLTVQQRAQLRLGKDERNNDTISASFTLSQLRKHLQAFGHNYSLPQIDEALRVCQDASIRLTCEDGSKKAMLSSGIFQSYSALDAKGDKTGESAYRHVVFNPLVTSSILEGTSRTINFERVMSLKSPLSRWLYDRLSHNFRQAVKGGAIVDKGYHISLSTILRESGFTAEEQQRNNIKKVRSALAELKAQAVLDLMCAYKEVLTHGEKPARGPAPVADVVWTLYPSRALVDEIIRGNQDAKMFL